MTQEAASGTELQGTFACPICGCAEPHSHSQAEQEAYRDDQIRRDGWTALVLRKPAHRGWYLCIGVDVPKPERDEDGRLGARASQLDWFLWVREGRSSSAGCLAAEVPEVCYFDYMRMWSLRNFLGNAQYDGSEGRYPVGCYPKYWREIPTFGTAAAEQDL